MAIFSIPGGAMSSASSGAGGAPTLDSRFWTRQQREQYLSSGPVAGGQTITDPQTGQTTIAPESRITRNELFAAGPGATPEIILEERAAKEERRESLFNLRRQLGFDTPRRRSARTGTTPLESAGPLASGGIVLG